MLRIFLWEKLSENKDDLRVYITWPHFGVSVIFNPRYSKEYSKLVNHTHFYNIMLGAFYAWQNNQILVASKIWISQGIHFSYQKRGISKIITIRFHFVEAIYSNQLSDVLKMAKSNLLYQITIFYSEWSDELENAIKALDDLTNVSRQFIFISIIMKNKEEKIRFVFKIIE